jgi:CMP-N-acetylneuraminic acid synthetase
MIDVVNHVISHYGESDQNIDIITLLQPTSPLRTAEHIRLALEEYNKNTEYRSLVSFCEIEHHPYKSFFLNENNKISPVF